MGRIRLIIALTIPITNCLYVCVLSSRRSTSAEDISDNPGISHGVPS